MRAHEPIDPEVVDEEATASTAVERRSPVIPVTLAELAALKGEALEIIEARIQVLTTLRAAAIRMTSPEDWLLFKSPDGRVTGYLQDAGADRVRDLYGIEIFNVSVPEKIQGAQSGQFHYLMSGSGRCKLTRQVVENMEGGRSSTDDFCRGKSGAELELAVRKAARANLDGGITRELSGLKSVPVEELEASWKGTSKKLAHCRYGKGFGSGAERRGADIEEAPGVTKSESPICPLCGTSSMKFKPAGQTKDGKPYAAFWSCFNYPQCKGTVKDADWRASRPDHAESRDPGAEG